MAINFTPMQEKAIKTEGTVLVSAAAGSGKTAVLVERVIRKITRKEKPVSIDKMLIVTFTNAAAAEMKRKIEKRLYEVCRENPDDEGLLRQKHLISSADICTIDSFCINLVRNNFEKCGVDPDFAVQDDSALASINKGVMSRVIGERMKENTPEFKRLLELTGCEYDEKELSAQIERVYLYSQQLPFPERFVRGLVTPYIIPFNNEHPWSVETFKKAFDILNRARKTLEKMAEVSLLLGEKHKAYTETLSLLVDLLLRTVSKGDWNEMQREISGAQIPRQPSVPSDSPEGKVFKYCKEKIVNAIGKVGKLFYAESEVIERELSKNRAPIELFAAMVNDYGKLLFEEYKKENVLTFHNTEQLALSFLCKSTPSGYELNPEAKEYLSRYDEVLVDEFQDVNDLQDTLFHILSGESKRLFIVGDVKQSIYGFRGSNPENFQKKKAVYKPVESGAENEPRKIILSDNFRSRKGICDYVNFVFRKLLNGDIGSIVYNEDEFLNASGDFPEIAVPAVDFLLADKTDDENEDARLVFEGKCIAEKILNIMKEGAVISDKEALRNAKYSDFVILLDSVKNKANVISEALKERGIPVSYGAEVFFETVEILTVTALLKIIDNPRNDIELLTVMMSPIFNFTAEELAIIRADFKKGEFYSAVNNAAQCGNVKVVNFLEKIAEMRREAAVLPVDKLLSKLYLMTDYVNFASAMTGGEMRRANLITLKKLASAYSSSYGGGIGGFLNYLKTLPEKAIKSSVGGGENCVRIMTMHASKGLQFPVCIISNLGGEINRIDSSEKILYTDKLGMGFKYYDYGCESDVEDLAHILVSMDEREKTTEEKMRLLYVALTRAIDRLVLVSTPSNPVSALNTAAANINNIGEIDTEWLKNSRHMNEWLLATALMHPDATVLRSICELGVRTEDDESKVRFTVMNTYNLSGIKAETEEEIKVGANEETAAKIRENISYKYPLDALKGVRSKISVSDLANRAESDKFAFTSRPSFMLKNGLSAAGRGTATHSVMQFIEMKEKPDVDAEIERLREWQFITEEAAEAVDKDAVKRFFESGVYDRIENAKELRREMRFLSEIPARRIDETLEGELGNTPVIVQGAVDLCFEEEDGIVVLDFKTDKADNLETLKETYSEQLNIYATAVEKIMGKPVKEKIIYSFNLSDYISF